MARLHYLSQPAWERGITVMMSSRIKTIAFSAPEKGNERLVYFLRRVMIIERASDRPNNASFCYVNPIVIQLKRINKQEAIVAPSARQLAEWGGSFAGDSLSH